MENLKKKLSYSFSDSDIKKYLGESCKIIKYGDLDNYSSLEELLPNDTDFVVILLETKKNTGHWTALLRYNNIFEWFDSYGLGPDKELTFIPDIMRRMFDEVEHELTKMLNDTPLPVIYNDKDLQSHKDFVCTCGRWVCLRILKLLRDNYNLKQFLDYLKMYKTEHKLKGPLAYDIIAVSEISFNGGI